MRVKIAIGVLLALVAGCGEASPVGTLVHEGPVALPHRCIAGVMPGDGSMGGEGGAAGRLVWVDVYEGTIREGPPLDAVDLAWDGARRRLLALERGERVIDVAGGMADMEIGTAAVQLWPVKDGALVYGERRWRHLTPDGAQTARVLPRPVSAWDEPGTLVWLGVGHPRASARLALVRVPETAPLRAPPELEWLDLPLGARAAPSADGPIYGYVQGGALEVTDGGERIRIPVTATTLKAIGRARPHVYVAVLGSPPLLVAFNLDGDHHTVALAGEPRGEPMRALAFVGGDRVVVATTGGLVIYRVDHGDLALEEIAALEHVEGPLAGPMPCPAEDDPPYVQ